MNPLLEQFLEEARENLAFIEQNIESLGDGDAELLNAIFRAAHTLKGGSGIVGFESVKEITHSAEDLLDMLRAGKLSFEPQMTDALYDAFDEVMNLVEAAEQNEDIVDADEEIVSNIKSTLEGLMGKDSSAEVAWDIPFTPISDISSITELYLDFFEDVKSNLPDSKIVLDEESITQTHLYAIYFDVDEDCMVYGNDPVYALSLLGDKVVHINSCMDEEVAKSVLSGLEDEDGLQLKIRLIAFVEATYDEIEEALFNFVDDLLILPLDINTMLEVNSGEDATIDLLKDFIPSAKEAMANADASSLRDQIEAILPLIGTKSRVYKRLLRLKTLSYVMSEDTLKAHQGYLDNLEAAEAVVESQKVETTVVEEEPNQSVPEEIVEEKSVSASAPAEVSENDLNSAKEIFTQQLAQLRLVDDNEVMNRVMLILQRSAPFIGVSVPETFSSKSDMISWIEGTIQGNAPATAPAQTTTQESAKEKVEVEKTTVAEQSTTKAPAETSIAQESSMSVEPVVQTLESVTPEVEPEVSVAKKDVKAQPKKSAVVGKMVKIEQELVDHLMNIVGELLVVKNSLPYLAEESGEMDSESIKRSILEKFTSFNRLSSQLQDLIMSMRMLPISYVFDRYPKLVRDISKNLGKRVKLTMEGGDTKLDKNMIEMLADPLIHIMRNSLDHGIEMPDVRTQNGKSAEGNVTLRAYPQSDKIIIDIIDDGAGINVDKVVHKVLEKGLLDIEVIEKMSEDEKASLVLLAGLSTADTISEYSGRGVGMDVVKKSIDSFGGSISIKTTKGKGTTIKLEIPVSLAVTSLLHVSMNNIHYGFPMDSVNETVKINSDEITYLHNEPFIYLRGEVIPLLMIEGMLNKDMIEENILPIVVLNIKGNLVAVVVNELLGQLEVVQKPMEGMLQDHPIFSGTALLGNGQIIMVMDPVGVLGMSDSLKEKVN